MSFFQDKLFCNQIYPASLLCGASALLQKRLIAVFVQVFCNWETGRAPWSGEERMSYLLESWHSRRILLPRAPLRIVSVPSQVEEVRTDQVKPVLLVPSHAVAAWYSSPDATPSSQLMTRSARAQRGCGDSFATHGALFVPLHIWLFSSLNKTQISMYWGVLAFWKQLIAMMSLCRYLYVPDTLVWRHGPNVRITKYKMLSLFLVFNNIHPITNVNPIYILCRIQERVQRKKLILAYRFRETGLYYNPLNNRKSYVCRWNLARVGISSPLYLSFSVSCHCR